MKPLSIIHTTIVIALAFAATILFFGMERDMSVTRWFIHFFVDKTAAICLAILCVRLCSTWKESDPFFRSIHEFVKEK